MELNEVELHVHVLQCLYSEDLFDLAKDVYHEINWNRFKFLDRYEQIFGIRLDPIAIFERAVKNNSLKEIDEINTYKYNGNGNFDEFDIKSFFPICISGYYFDLNNPYPVLKKIVNRHKKEGIKYIEYRNGFGGYGEEWKKWHAMFARFFKDESNDNFEAKYIIRLGSYKEVKEIIDENPDLVSTIVGVDFSGKEINPSKLISFYQEVAQDKVDNPNKTVDIVVHIGENFFDKSIESAIRWCHLSALYGAKRLAHCIALGISPSIAIKRKENAHVYESVEERIEQINYDLKYQNELEKYGIEIDKEYLLKELEDLLSKNPQELIKKEYTDKRLAQIEKRQDFTLDELSRLNTIIEVCPTSNLCIGGVPSIASHPLHKLIKSKVNLVICSDDPGIFASSLKDEVEFVKKEFALNDKQMKDRFKDPYLYRLKAK